jgi:cytochrome c oxidase subunit IV
MEPNSQTDVPRVAPPPPPVSVFDELSKVLVFARETLSSFLELVSLEGRRAGLSLVWMFVGGLIAAIFIVTAWAGLMAALAMYVVSLGMLPIAAVIVVAAVNLIAGAGMLYWCIGLSRHLLFSATRRQLAGSSMVRPSTP